MSKTINNQKIRMDCDNQLRITITKTTNDVIIFIVKRKSRGRNKDDECSCLHEE